MHFENTRMLQRNLFNIRMQNELFYAFIYYNHLENLKLDYYLIKIIISITKLISFYYKHQ